MFRVEFQDIGEGKRRVVIKTNIHDGMLPAYEDFHKHYKLISVLAPIEEMTSPIAPVNEGHKCRFCLKTYPDTTFKKRAHIIPFALGDNYVLASDECDSCNAKFGEYESDLIYYLGATKVLLNPSSKKFAGPGGTKIFRENLQNKKAPLINILTPEDSTEVSRKENGSNSNSVKFCYSKPAYRPIYVYNALLKMALSALPTALREKYDELYMFIFDNYGFDIMARELLMTEEHTLFGMVTYTPHVLLYRKIDDNDRCISLTACIYFYNKMFQILLPLNRDDDWMQANVSKIRYYKCPPLIDKSIVIKNGYPKSKSVFLNTFEKVFGEKVKVNILLKDSVIINTISV